MKIKPGTLLKNGVPVFSVVLIIHTNQSFTDRALSKPALLKKGLRPLTKLKKCGIIKR